MSPLTSDAELKPSGTNVPRSTSSSTVGPSADPGSAPPPSATSDITMPTPTLLTQAALGRDATASFGPPRGA